MTDTTAPQSFADTIIARLISLAIAVLIGVIFFVYWADDIGNLTAEQPPELPVVQRNATSPAIGADLQQCLEQRVGDVTKMQSEGVINDAQYAEFRQRAEDLCYARHSQ